jgi:HTH-like domain
MDRTPDLASDRAKRDKVGKENTKRIFGASGGRYGARKVWHALWREGKDIARCTVERPLAGHCFAMPCRAVDNALAESTIGLFKTEVINFPGPWKTMSRSHGKP